jgi:tRNA(fMet)-specific endonuclease VapC
VSGELYYGAIYSSQIHKNLSKIQSLFERYKSLPLDEATSLEYGNIKAALRKKGKPIPDNDIWIAALAKQHALILVTRDKHFKGIEGVTIKQW